MTNEIKITYGEALELALPYFCDFYDFNDRYVTEKDGESYDWREWMQHRLAKRANACCCALEMVQSMFHVSDERIHEDLFAMRAKLRAN